MGKATERVVDIAVGFGFAMGALGCGLGVWLIIHDASNTDHHPLDAMESVAGGALIGISIVWIVALLALGRRARNRRRIT